MPHISVTCPKCAARNEITTSEPPAEPVNIQCTGCHAPLGTWRQMVEQNRPPEFGDTWPAGSSTRRQHH